MKDSRIVIVGFMACGKTTVAEALARQLDCDWIDLDSFITERERRSPAEIIEHDGESAFRVVETRAFADVLATTEARVIALGGGAWTIAANRALVDQNDCLSVWLNAPFELCWERIAASGNAVRPMAPDRESAQRLYSARRESYELAYVRIEVSVGGSIVAIADQIKGALPSD